MLAPCSCAVTNKTEEWGKHKTHKNAHKHANKQTNTQANKDGVEVQKLNQQIKAALHCSQPWLSFPSEPKQAQGQRKTCLDSCTQTASKQSTPLCFALHMGKEKRDKEGRGEKGDEGD